MHVTTSRLWIVGPVSLFSALKGVRKPWTLAGDDVWSRTRKAAGKWSMLAGLATLGILFAIVPVIAAALYATVYSCAEYRRLSKES